MGPAGAGMGQTRFSVSTKWRRRFLEQGISGLHDELRPGRPRPISDERVAQLVRKTLRTKPAGRTHWSIRQVAAESGVSKSTVHRIWYALACNRIGKNISNSRAIHFL